jgi:hypothetical protein
MPKWVGFDMDECIGSVMPLYAFVKHLPKGKAIDTMKSSLYASERMKTTWLIRPAIYDALEMLYRAYKSGEVYGAFIFSNNGSQELVNFIADFLNGWMVRRFSDYSRPPIFKMAVHRTSRFRTPGSLDKSYNEVQRALAGHGLPLLESERDLLFFDDMVHVLTDEIRDYVQVRAYMNHCPLEKVIGALADCEAVVGSEAWGRILEKARYYEKEYHGGDYISTPPTVAQNIMDKHMFTVAFRRFLGRGGRTGRATRRRRQKVRKNTLRHK